MRCIKVIIMLVSVILLVTGCEHVRKLDKSNEYQNAQVYDKDIVLPRDLDASKMENYYPILKARSGSYNVSTLPPGSNIK